MAIYGIIVEEDIGKLLVRLGQPEGICVTGTLYLYGETRRALVGMGGAGEQRSGRGNRSGRGMEEGRGG